METKGERGHFGSRVGFVLAAAGSAVGLGNIWKFPYITGKNGGGAFVLVYLLCVLLVALPIMMAEIFLGRASQKSPVGAFRLLAGRGSPWVSFGWLGLAAGFVILSYYSVVAGWSLHYLWLSLSGGLKGLDADGVGALFGKVNASPGINLVGLVLFMGLTVGIVIFGVKRGIETSARWLMPILFLMLLALAIDATTTDGFARGVDFVFGARFADLTAAGTLEALGHSFFTLSLGMGALITYGSYLRRDTDLVGTSLIIGLLDTIIALLACLVIFPIVFSAGLDVGEGAGLVFVSLPIAFGKIAGGAILAPVFFLLLAFAALTSTISLLEVTVSYFIDELGWGRRRATLVVGSVITLMGVPCALSGGTEPFQNMFTWMPKDEQSWFGFWAHVSSNWMLPLGGLGIAVFTAWRVSNEAREAGFKAGSRLGHLYWAWVGLLRYVVPVGIVAVFLHATGFFKWMGWLK
ncbi:MAG: sodium-dependent transporter [Planctomycetota bacterium]